MSSVYLSEQEAAALFTIAEDDFADIVDLVGRMGYDHRTFFVGRTCSGLDFTGSDIQGVSFLDADLNGAHFFRDQLGLVDVHFRRITVAAIAMNAL